MTRTEVDIYNRLYFTMNEADFMAGGKYCKLDQMFVALNYDCGECKLCKTK